MLVSKLTERLLSSGQNENERFYGQRIGVADILAGKARHPPPEIKMLMETVKAAEGRSDVDEGMMQELEDQPAPADLELQAPQRQCLAFQNQMTRIHLEFLL